MNSKFTTRLFALAVAVVCFAASASAQLSVSVSRTTLKEALVEVEKQSGYSFFYSSELPNMDKLVSIEASGQSISQILDSLFEGLGIDYSISADKQVTLSKRAIGARKTTPPSKASNQLTIKGVVTDSSGNPIIGASVFVEGTTIGTTTYIDGSYTLSVKSTNDIVTFSYLGCEDQSLQVGNRTEINVVLKESTSVMDEVVVVAYGTQKKANLSGSVASVNFEEAGEKRALTNLSAGLQGVSAGVLATQSSGEPGADAAAVTIRGVGTLNNSAPLVVIDGIIGTMDDVNTNDVATMSILKDAASSAIYGSRAANGVILITTKSGQSGKSKVSYNGRAGVQKVAVPIDVVSDYVTYMQTINTASLNAGNVAPFTTSIIKEWAENSKTDPIIYPNTDWFDVTFKPATIQEHNVQASGGNQATNYLLSIGYLGNNGTIQKTNYDRYSLRANISSKVTDWLKVSLIMNGFHGVQTGIDVSTTMSSLGNSSPGTLPVHPDGRFGGEWAPGGNVQAGNIFAALASYDKTTNTTKASGKLGFEIEFTPSLKLISNFAVAGGYSHTLQMNYTDINYWDFKKDAILVQIGTTSHQLSETYARNHSLIGESYLQWDILPDNDTHNLSMTAGYNQEYNYSHNSYIQALDVLSSDTPVLNAATTPSKITGTSTDNAVMSFFGRVNYDYKGRYILEANMRADGSSRFAKGNRWGYFPSFSAAWRLSEESFMEDAEWVDNLKVRASWGQLGNNAVGDYATQLLYQRKQYVFGDTAVTGAGISAIVNTDLKWETTTMANLGVDFGLAHNRLNVSVDLFDKQTNDILVRTTIPYVLGDMTAPVRNVGAVRNRGVEVEAAWSDKIGDLRYSISGNYSYITNKVLKYQGDVAAYSGQKILLEGYSIWSYYVREVECIATQEKIDRMLADGYVFYPSTPHPGDFIYKDQQQPGEKGYKIINDDDRVIKGTSTPKHFFGLNLAFEWKGFDFSTLFSGVAGVKQYLNGTWYTNVIRNGSAINTKFLDAWSITNQDSTIPALTTDDGGRNTVSNDYWLQDGSYLKLRNLTIGYTLPERWLKPLVSRARIYLTGENLFTLTAFEGLDPETGSTSNYPNMKRFMVGVSMTF